MPRVIFTEKANLLFQEIIVAHLPDDTLLQRFHDHLDIVAEHPTTMTEIAKLPYKPNRLMTNFELSDDSQRIWGFTVTLRRTPDEDGIEILTVAGMPYS